MRPVQECKKISYHLRIRWFSSACLSHIITGMLTLSPMIVAPVCRVGDPVQIYTCTASSAEFLEWSLRQTNEQGRDEEITTFSNS